MAAIDFHGRPIHKGDKLIRADAVANENGNVGHFIARDVGRKGSRDDGRVRIAVSHWEKGSNFVVSRRAPR